MVKKPEKTEKEILEVFCGDCKYCEPYKHTVSYCEHPKIRMPILIELIKCIYYEQTKK